MVVWEATPKGRGAGAMGWSLCYPQKEIKQKTPQVSSAMMYLRRLLLIYNQATSW